MVWSIPGQNSSVCLVFKDRLTASLEGRLTSRIASAPTFLSTRYTGSPQEDGKMRSNERYRGGVFLRFLPSHCAHHLYLVDHAPTRPNQRFGFHLLLQFHERPTTTTAAHASYGTWRKFRKGARGAHRYASYNTPKIIKRWMRTRI